MTARPAATRKNGRTLRRVTHDSAGANLVVPTMLLDRLRMPGEAEAPPGQELHDGGT